MNALSSFMKTTFPGVIDTFRRGQPAVGFNEAVFIGEVDLMKTKLNEANLISKIARVAACLPLLKTAKVLINAGLDAGKITIATTTYSLFSSIFERSSGKSSVHLLFIQEIGKSLVTTYVVYRIAKLITTFVCIDKNKQNLHRLNNNDFINYLKREELNLSFKNLDSLYAGFLELQKHRQH